MNSQEQCRTIIFWQDWRVRVPRSRKVVPAVVQHQLAVVLFLLVLRDKMAAEVEEILQEM